jgi:hypothetical protein
MRIRSVFAFLAAAFFVCVLGSCGKKALFENPVTPPSPPVAHDAPVAVRFAYGYNDADFLAETKGLIRERFSREDDLVTDEDIMLPLIFPDDFPSGRISLLYDKIHNADLSAFVLLGSPEGTHRTLAGLQDTWAEQGGAIPVVSLFSQDDVLGTEAGSDVVVDFVPLPESPAAVDDAEKVTAARRIPPATVVQILAELHQRAVAGRSNDSPDANEPDAITIGATTTVSADKDTVLALFGPAYLVTPYHDAETGLIAANHFLVDLGGVQ